MKGMIKIALERFKDDDLYSPLLEYFYDQWINISKDVENRDIGLGIINHRILLNDIKNEYVYNDYSNQNNRKIYIELLNELLKKEYLKIYNDELLLMKESLEVKDFEMVHFISEKLSHDLSHNNFVLEIYTNIEDLLFKKEFSEVSRERIQKLTEEIIIDLVTFGFEIKEISKLLIDAFESYTVTDSHVHVRYLNKFENLSNDEKMDYLDSITIEERLNCFKEHLLKNRSDFVFVFPLYGIRGSIREESIPLANTKVYHPHLYDKQYVQDLHFMNYENKESNSNESICYVEVKVEANSVKSGRQKAIDKLNNVINILNFYYGSDRKEVFWDGQVTVLNNDYSNNSSFMPYWHDNNKKLRRITSLSTPISINKEGSGKVKNINSVLSDLQDRNMTFEYNTLLNIISLLSKTKFGSDEDKIIYYWASLEGLSDLLKIKDISKVDLIKEILSNIYYRHEQYVPIHNLYHKTILHLLNDKHRKILDIPNLFLKETNLDKGMHFERSIDIVPFFERKKELTNFTNDESYSDEINSTLNFYQDNSLALKRLTKKRKEVLLTIDYIYKTRNQIVHNGFIDRNLIPFLIRHLESYSSSYFNFVIEAYIDNSYNLEKFFKEIDYDCKLLEKKLKSKDHYNISLGHI